MEIVLAGSAGLWRAWLSASATAGGMGPTARIVTLIACMPACNFLFDVNLNPFFHRSGKASPIVEDANMVSRAVVESDELTALIVIRMRVCNIGES